MFWQIRKWILSLRPKVLFPGKCDFRLDFYRRNPKGLLLSGCVIEVQLRIAHLFERLHFAAQRQANRFHWNIERLRLAYYLKRLDSAIKKGYKTLRNQHGMANIEVMIILGCFAIIVLVASLAMFSTGGQGAQDVTDVIEKAGNHIEANIEEVIETAVEDAAEVKNTLSLDACLYFCELDYENGLTNVVQYQECLNDCQGGQ